MSTLIVSTSLQFHLSSLCADAHRSILVHTNKLVHGLALCLAELGDQNGRVVPSTLAFYDSFHSSIVPTRDFVHFYFMVELTIEFAIVFCDSTVG